jgi:ribonuclease D
MKHYFNVQMNKSHQRDNWGARPLSQDSLRYAQTDTHYLPDLRDTLQKELEEMGRWEEAVELFKEAEDVPPAEPSFDPEGYWKLTTKKYFKRSELGILRELFLMREDIAKSRDVPVHHIIPNKIMINIVKASPTSIQHLDRVHGVRSLLVGRYGHEIVAAVNQGKSKKSPTPPPAPNPPPQDISDRYLALQQWRKKKGEERGVESDVVLTKDLMWKLAWRFPQTEAELPAIEGLGVQRIALYGDEIIASLANL